MPSVRRMEPVIFNAETRRRGEGIEESLMAVNLDTICGLKRSCL